MNWTYGLYRALFEHRELYPYREYDCITGIYVYSNYLNKCVLCIEAGGGECDVGSVVECAQ